MSKSGAHSRRSLPFQEITTKLSSDELVKRLKVVCPSTEKQYLFHLVITSNKCRIGTPPGLSSEYLAQTLCHVYCAATNGCSSLQACSKFLAETEDLEDTIATPLASLSAVLVESFVQHHKTKEVRLLAACCIAELFRLFYPDPPYDEDQLKVCRLESSLTDRVRKERER